MNRAKDDKRVKAVILKVDSPGGEVLASDAEFIARFPKDFQERTPGKPVVCSMGSLAASGGYYISAPSRWIVANDLTITGSIGVILHTWNYRGLMDKVGLAPVTYKSGKFKDMLSGDRSTNEIPAEERVMVQGLIDETYQRFKNVVCRWPRRQAHEKNKKEGRALALDWTNYADGRVLSGTQASRSRFRGSNSGIFDDAVKAREKNCRHSQRQSDRIPRALRYFEFPAFAGPERICPTPSNWTWAWTCPSSRRASFISFHPLSSTD